MQLFKVITSTLRCWCELLIYTRFNEEIKKAYRLYTTGTLYGNVFLSFYFIAAIRSGINFSALGVPRPVTGSQLGTAE